MQIGKLFVTDNFLTYFCVIINTPLLKLSESSYNMKKIYLILCLLLPFRFLFAQTPTNVFEIENILVDACGAGTVEGENEMLMFQVGPYDLNTANLSVSGAGATGIITVNNWPTTTNLWLGLVQNTTTAGKVSQMNSTIAGCRFYKEPVGGVLPAGSKVLFCTSTAINTALYDFTGVLDTVYVIFQNSGTTQGNFANYSAGTSTRTLVLTFTGTHPWADTVVYQPGSLIDQAGASVAADGAGVSFSWNGSPHYYNVGCKAPVNTQLYIWAQLPACWNVPITFTSSIINGFSNPVYVWKRNGTVVGTNSPSYTVTNPPNNCTISLMVIDTNCSINDTFFSNTLIVPVTPALGKPGTPVAASPACPNNPSICFTSGSSNATSYQWYVTPSTAGTFTTNPNTNNPTLTWNPSFYGVARIYVFGVNGPCYSLVSDTLKVTVSPLPLKPAKPTGPDTLLCINPTNTSYTTTGSTFSNTYTWGLLPATAGSISGTGLTGSVTWTPGYTGNVKVFLKGVDSCGAGPCSDTLIVQIMALPGFPAAPAGTTTLCQGTTTTNYTTTGGTNASSYQWSILPVTAGTIAGASTTGTVTWSPTFSGAVKIYVKGVNYCGVGIADSLAVTVSPKPSKPGTPVGISPVCPNGTSAFVTSGSTNATSYTWYIIPTAAGSIAGTGTTGTVTWTSTYSGFARIIVYGNNSCGSSLSASDTLLITVNPNPGKPTIPVGTSPLCQGAANTAYHSHGGTNCVSYSWNIIPATAGTIAGTDTIGTVTWSPTFTGTVKIVVRGVNACGNGPSSDTLVVTVNPTPAKPVIPNGPNPVCQGVATSIYTTAGTPLATSYLWYLLPATAGTINGTIATDTVHWSPTFSGIAKIFVRGVNACGNGLLSSDTLFITVNPIPAKPGIPTGTNPICQGTLTSNFITSGSQYATSIVWGILPATSGTIAGIGDTSTVTWSAAYTGSVQIFCHGVNACGVGPTSDTLTLTINPLPGKPATPTGLISLCEGTVNTDYNTTGSTNGVTYHWGITPSAAGSISGTGTIGTVTWSSTFTGTANIFVIGINACGQGPTSDTLTVTVQPIPHPDLGNDLLLCSGDNHLLDPGNFPGCTYLWSDGSTSTTLNYMAPELIPDDSTTLQVNISVTVTQANCIVSDAIILTIRDCEVAMDLPNVFTPNGDGHNDVFKPGRKKGIVKMTTSIFNRWGKLIYNTSDLSINWTGDGAADGVYYYYITCTDFDGEVTSKNGTITLLRGQK